MGAFLGVPGSKVVDPSSVGVFPRRAQILPADWQEIQGWYLQEAPDRLDRPAGVEKVSVGLTHFRSHALGAQGAPSTTLVRIDTAGRRVLWSGSRGERSQLHLAGVGDWSVDSLQLSRPSSDITLAGDTVFATGLGDLLASDRAWGALEAYAPAGVAAPLTLLSELQRPVQSLRLDVNQDGTPDWVVAEFGKYTGGLNWYEGVGEGGFRRHSILPLPGAVRMHLGDHDHDGRQDLLVAFGQGDERISWFRRTPEGFGREQRLLSFPPTNGTVDFQLADVNGDGRDDLIYVSGDNADYARPDRKPYHGITVFLRGEGDAYAEAYRFPLDGAYGVRVADFDLDGDPDLAAIAFFPDLTADPLLSFVYLENVTARAGDLAFIASTPSNHRSGRFMVMDAADMDGDGDCDIVLGSYAGFPADRDSSGLQAQWMASGSPVVVLENTTR